jgi:hypothetical protein
MKSNITVTHCRLQRAFLLCALSLLAACDQLNVEKVRQGTLDLDTSKTLGDAFGRSNLISNGQWSGFESDEGSQIVEFTGRFDGLQEALDEVFSELKANPQAAALAALGSGGEMGAIGLGFLMNAPLSIESCEYEIQFLLSKRDDSFNIGAATLKAVIRNTQTGSLREQTFSDDEDTVLTAIYEGDKIAIAFLVLGQAMQAELAEGLLQQLQN